MTTRSVVLLSQPQADLLRDVPRHPWGEFFAPNMSVARALEKRGLIRIQFIGMRYWCFYLTVEGTDALGKIQTYADPRQRHGSRRARVARAALRKEGL